jgi:hypothetical protein
MPEGKTMSTFNHIPPELVLQTILTIISGVLSSFLAYWFHRFQIREAKRDAERAENHRRVRESEAKRDKTYAAMRNGIQSLLRNSLIHQCEKYESAGWIDHGALANIDLMYNAYHALGGNGMVTAYYDRVQHLPHVRPIATKRGE